MIDMTQFHDIKFLKEVEGLSQRQISKRLGIARNTVSKYLKQDQVPTTILRQQTYATKEYSDETKRVLSIIDEWLEDDQKRGESKNTQQQESMKDWLRNMSSKVLNLTFGRLLPNAEKNYKKSLFH
ncbi:helix-turn-helix domain-containing protein [Halalkalibacter lacteus]|uniref:helix-turn-helix domain-containing protein n=1 Tax=Halalkalibacter lacteus TaxID=3090663 RepID=UPI002FCB5B40